MNILTNIKAYRRAALGLGLALSIGGCSSLPPVDPVDTGKVHWLNGGPRWTQDEREWYHSTTQGTATYPIPYNWFVALEQPGNSNHKLFKEQDYLGRMGFIRTAGPSKVNPDSLPVGLARMANTVKPVPGEDFMIDPKTGKLDAIGLTCAACHTGQINYKGNAIGIDGGQSNINIVQFGVALGLAMGQTNLSTRRFKRFALRVVGTQDQNDPAFKQLKSNLSLALDRLLAINIFLNKQLGDVAFGYGRIDALTSIGNQVFGNNQLNSIVDLKLARENEAANTAPVSYPYLWDTAWFEWVQYDASIMSVSVRNSGESMGVVAMTNMVTPSNYWDSTVKIKKIHKMESMLAGLGTTFANTPAPYKEKAFRGLWSPKWPEKLLTEINQDITAQGATLYKELCESCHLPPISPSTKVVFKNQKSFWDKKFWVKKYKPTVEIFNEYRKEHGLLGETKQEVLTNCPTPKALGKRDLVYPWRLLRLPIIPLDILGTDPAQADILTNRKVTTPSNMGIDYGDLTTHPKPGFDQNWFALALGSSVQNVNDRWNKDNNISKKEALWLSGGRPNCLQATMAYKARPLDGVWATSPFLHNGSVPTLYDLLTPAAERPSTFWTGSREFDPEKVGYISVEQKGLFKFDATIPGNLNTGHQFVGDGTPKPGQGIIGREMSPRERLALIEFLKTQ